MDAFKSNHKSSNRGGTNHFACDFNCGLSVRNYKTHDKNRSKSTVKSKRSGEN